MINQDRNKLQIKILIILIIYKLIKTFTYLKGYDQNIKIPIKSHNIIINKFRFKKIHNKIGRLKKIRKILNLENNKILHLKMKKIYKNH
jgi:hypothetical protein